MSKPRMGASKRVAVGLLAGALSVFGVAFAPTAGAVTDVTTDRVAGTTRFGTASAACARAYPAGTATAIIATARNFPDALAASGLAGARNACIFLTEVDDVPEATLQGLTQNKITNSIIVGGTNAVSTAAENELRAAGQTVTRIAGANRYATAAAIANAITTVGAVGGAATCIVASGEVAADALAAGPVAARGDGTNPFPILLVRPNEVPSETAAALQAKCKNVILVGGTAAISEAVRTQIGTLTGDTSVDRVAGTDRFLTAVAIANYAIGTLRTFAAPSTVLLANGLPASGEPFSVDALVAGPLGDVLGAPILLVQQSTLGTAVRDFLDANSPTIRTILGVGGTAVIDQAVLDAADTAAQTTNNDTPAGGTSVTARPELINATVVVTTAVGSNPGTTVRYLFDEALTGTFTGGTAAFKLYTSGGAPLTAAGGSAIIDPSDNKAVLVTFPTLTSTGAVSAYTVATVVAGAVTQLSGGINATNPEGDAALAGTSATAATAGVTAAPDLVSVGNFRASGTADTLVDFTFDQASTVATPTGFHLVTVAGTRVGVAAGTSQVDCTAIQPPAGTTTFGNGTTVQTASCVNNIVTGPLSNANVARGFVDQGAVTGSGGTGNPLEAADVANGGNNNNTPNLVSATFEPAAVVGATAVDAVLYTFDRPVLLPTGAQTGGAGYGVYLASGATVLGSAGAENTGGTEATRSTSNDTQVRVVFADGTLNSAVGANVFDSAAVSASTGTGNEEDEVAVAPAAIAGTAGRTDGPDLVSVNLTQTRDAFGTVIATTATFTFDEAVAAPTDAAAGSFKLWGADGSGPFACSGTTGAGTLLRPSASTSSIVCSSFAGTTSLAQSFAATLGTVATGAVTEAAGAGLTNPEGAEATTGGNGTPQV